MSRLNSKQFSCSCSFSSSVLRPLRGRLHQTPEHCNNRSEARMKAKLTTPSARPTCRFLDTARRCRQQVLGNSGVKSVRRDATLLNRLSLAQGVFGDCEDECQLAFSDSPCRIRSIAHRHRGLKYRNRQMRKRNPPLNPLKCPDATEIDATRDGRGI